MRCFLKKVFSLFILRIGAAGLLCIASSEIMASSAAPAEVNPYSHPSATKYQTFQWDPSRVHHHMWEALKDCEGQALGQTEYLDKPGMESFAVMIGTNYVARLKKGIGLCEELDHVNNLIKTFLEKKADFSNDGLTICLPVRCFFLTPSNGSDDYADLLILPKAKGHSLALSLFQGVHSDSMGDIFWSAGRALAAFHMFFMKNHGTHVTTAKHNDMSIGNIFYEPRNVMGKDQWAVSWIDCTDIALVGHSPLTEVGHLIANIEHRLLEASAYLSQINIFQEKVLEGYCSRLSQDIIGILHGLLNNAQSFETESWLLGERTSVMRTGNAKVYPENILKLIHHFFGRHIESQQKAEEEAKAVSPTTTTTPAVGQQEGVCSQTHSDAENTPLSSGQGASLALTVSAVPVTEK